MRDALLQCLGLTALLLSAGCTEEEEVLDQGLVPTAVSVDPQEFPSELTCGQTEGALRSFVAVFVDDGAKQPNGQYDAGNQFYLPASPPTPCSEVASFRYVVLGHGYWAEVDGYVEPAEELVPAVLGCNSSGAAGSRQQCTADAAGKLVPVTPRWRMTCGEADASHAIAKNNTDVRVLGCRLSGDPPEAGPTSVLVDPNAALGTLSCQSDEGGDVATLAVLPEDGSLPPLLDIPCGVTPAPYAENIEPGKTYTFRVEARAEAEGPVVWGTSCFVVPKAGIVNAATCDPLTDRGSLTVAVDCPPGATHIQINVDIGAETEVLEELDTVACGEPATVNGVLAGDYDLKMKFLDAAHLKLGDELDLTCSAVVPPGGSGAADCPL